MSYRPQATFLKTDTPEQTAQKLLREFTAISRALGSAVPQANSNSIVSGISVGPGGIVSSPSTLTVQNSDGSIILLNVSGIQIDISTGLKITDLGGGFVQISAKAVGNIVSPVNSGQSISLPTTFASVDSYIIRVMNFFDTTGAQISGSYVKAVDHLTVYPSFDGGKVEWEIGVL